MLVDTRDLLITPFILLYGEWEPEESRYLLGLLKPGMNFVDVGSNMGYVTCLALKGCMPGGQVWAFEADPQLCQLTQENVLFNWYFEGVTVENVAIYDRSTTLRFNRRERFQGNSTVGQPDAAEVRKFGDTVTSFDVKAISLDEYFLPKNARVRPDAS